MSRSDSLDEGPTARRVLLIEDNELDARTMVHALANASAGSIEVTRSGDLKSGLVALQTGSFDCVLLDLSLPDSEGLDGVDRVVEAATTCPTVVLTGLDDPAIAVQAVAHGAQDFLVKGTATPELVERSVRYAITRFWTESRLVHAERRLEAVVTREQIARDLHDTVIQRLFASGMSLQAGVGLADDELRSRVRDAVNEIDDAIRELREAIFGLHSHAGSAFEADVFDVVESFRAALGTEPVVSVDVPPELSDQAKHHLLAATREALANITKHTSATAVDVVLSEADGFVVLEVRHLGDINAKQADSSDSDDATGPQGVRNLAARAEEQGGDFDIRIDAGASRLLFRIPTGTDGTSDTEPVGT